MTRVAADHGTMAGETRMARFLRVFVPFADVATADLPLGRLIRLSLFQLSVGITLVLLGGTLNRVMAVELGIPVTLIASAMALPLLLAPARMLIGFKSDHRRSYLGWRRTPYVWLGANPGPGLHNAGYNFDDSIIPIGSAFLARMVERRTAA